MDESIAAPLVEAGILGLWTLSLLWQQQRTDKKHEARERSQLDRHAAERTEMTELREKHLDAISVEVQEIEHKLDTALSKIDQGLEAMRQKYAEDRARELAEIKVRSE
jgi:uncharacterized protein HemX